MLITKSDIEITESGAWYFQGNQIVNPSVLNYFKANLGRDKEGYFILNRFGERLEKGYLKSVQGFALFVLRLFVVRQADLGGLDLSKFYNIHGKKEALEALSQETHFFQCSLDAGTRLLLPLERLHIFDERTLALELNGNRAAPLYARLSASVMASLWENLAEDEAGYVFHILTSQPREKKSFGLHRASFEELLYERKDGVRGP